MPTVQVGELAMYYEVHGDGPPLVLIGGLSADLTLFAPLTGLLARRFRILTFDNRGAGRTGKPDVPYSIPMMAADTLGLMDALDIERAHVLGVSMGGKIALELAMTHPRRVDRLVLVSTSAARRGRMTMSLPMRLLGLLAWLGLLRKEHPQPSYAHQRQRQASTQYDAVDRIGRIRTPTLILHGRSDRSTPLAAAQQMHAGIAGSQLEVFRGGHMFFLLTQRTAVIDRIEDFLARGSAA